MIASKFSRAVLAAVVVASSVSAQCTFDITAQTGETCSLLASAFGITLAEFIEWNPSVGSNCGVGLVVGDTYCVAFTSSSSSSSSSGSSSTGTTSTKSTTSSTLVTSTKSITTTSSTSSAGPSPTQSGIPSNCDNFYLVKSGDSCSPIVAEFGITLTEFYTWNPAVGSTCATLLADYYVCVGVPGITTTPHQSSTSTNTNPQPEQTGIISTCNKFYLVQSGNSCSTIASEFGITLNEFYAWNPAVGSSCATLFAAYYVCVGIPGITTTHTPTPTGPSPEQTGIASNCNKYYLVKSGDTCAAISSANGVSLTNFYAWNPAVGSTCSTLLAGYYVCVDIPGVTPTTAATATGPTPTQTGITSSCNKWYKAVSGDTCDAIIAKYSITLAEFYAWNPAVGSSCASLFLGYYYCVGV